MQQPAHDLALKDDSPTDAVALERRCREGDRQALAACLELYRDRLLRIVQFRLDSRLRSRVAAEDVLQEAYLDAAQRLVHFGREYEGSVFLWLRTIVCQTLADTYRHHLAAAKRDVRQEVAVQGLNPERTSDSIAMYLFGVASSPSGAVRRGEMRSIVHKAIESMDPLDQEVLALRHFEELNNSEVATVLQIQQKAASIRYVRALRRLKALLSEYSLA